MREIPLHEVITAHTTALAVRGEEFLPMIRVLLLMGEGPVTPDRLATQIRWTPMEVEAFIRASGLVVDADGTLQTVAGAGCALDSLLLPLLSGRPSQVATTCPATGRPIRLSVTPDGVADLDPPSAVLALRLPGPETHAETVRGTICAYGHFFANRERASRWPRLHPEAVLLSVAEAALLAREIASAARRYAQQTEQSEV